MEGWWLCALLNWCGWRISDVATTRTYSSHMCGCIRCHYWICPRTSATRPTKRFTDVAGCFQWFLARWVENISPCDAYPCLLRAADSECVLLLHVDDVLCLVKEIYLNEFLVPALVPNTRYRWMSLQRRGWTHFLETKTCDSQPKPTGHTEPL